MTDILNPILQSPLVARTGWTLLHAVWEVGVVGGVLGVVLRVLRGSDPRYRYTCSFVALVACAVVPVLTFVGMGGGSTAAGGAKPQAAGGFAPVVRQGFENGATHHTALMPVSVATPPPAPLAPAPSIAATRRLPTPAQILPWLVLVWALGVTAMSLRNLLGYVGLRHLRTSSARPAGPRIYETAERLARRLNISPPVRVFQSALATTPLVMGALRPVILLPVSVLTDLSTSELESILAHELAHVRRHDYLANLLQCVIETVLFYHPVVWWISRRIRVEREHCCDDLALSVTRDRATYATALAAVASIRVPTLAPAAAGGKLLPRLRRVLGVPDSDAARPSRGLAGAIVAGCIAIGIAAPHLQPRATAADKPADDDTIMVRGVVLDPRGKPASAVKVTAAPSWPTSDDSHPAVIATATTGSDGRYQISFKKSDASAFSTGYSFSGADLWKKTQIVASSDGLGLDWQQFDHVNAAGDVELKLTDDVPVKGRIVDLEGRPIPNVTVVDNAVLSHILTDSAQQQHRPENYRGLGLPLAASGHDRTIVTDADGRFQITGLGKERLVTLEFKADTVAITMTRVMTREGPPVTGAWGSGDRAAQFKYYGSTFELAATPARIATGTVRDAQTHEPIAGARVEVDYGLHKLKTVTDAQGHYRLGGLEREGQVEIRASTGDRPYIPMISTLPKATGLQPVALDFDLFKGVWVTGRVTDQQTKAGILMTASYLPLASNQYAAKVPVFRQGWAQPPCFGETKPDGTYRLVASPGPGVVVVRGSSASYALGQGFDKIKTKDKNGFVATLLPRMANATWYAAGKEIDAAPDAVTEGIDFVLDPGATIHVTCTDPDGKPLDKLQVQGSQAGTGNAYFAAFDNSKFDATGFTADETRLIHVKDEQRHLATLATVRLADAKDGKLSLRLQPAAYVTGRLLTLQHDPIKGGNVRIDTYIPELKAANRFDIAVIRAEADGRFKLEIPPDVRLGVLASLSPYGGMFKPVTNDIKLAPGQTKDLGDIELSEEMMK